MSNISKSVYFPHTLINPAAAIDVQQQHSVPHLEGNDMNSCFSTHDHNALCRDSGYCVDLTGTSCHVGIQTIALYSSTAGQTDMLKSSKQCISTQCPGMKIKVAQMDKITTVDR